MKSTRCSLLSTFFASVFIARDKHITVRNSCILSKNLVRALDEAGIKFAGLLFFHFKINCLIIQVIFFADEFDKKSFAAVDLGNIAMLLADDPKL